MKYAYRLLQYYIERTLGAHTAFSKESLPCVSKNCAEFRLIDDDDDDADDDAG